MDQSQVTKLIHSLGDVVEDHDTREHLILFRTKANKKICAIIYGGSSPLRIEAKCDQRLAKVLRAKYETVLPSHNMDGRTWNEIICSGQLSEQQIKDLLTHSYNLVTAAA
ncbi:MmcQ/YjbR family DNA-binding protein [Candidatus Saccharibacteria bacterium]|nr:MmcQ/YjbR family DNA-binding protein [Candidatus Saccharibacteria bacterium]